MPTSPSGYGPNPVVMQQPRICYPPAYPGQPEQAISMPQIYPPMGLTAPSTGPPHNSEGGWQQPNMICPPGLEYLLPLDKIFMTQKVDGWEIATGFPGKNKYKIIDANGRQIYSLKEYSGWLGRAFFGNSRTFTMRVTDRIGREAIRMQRPLQFIGDSVEIFNGEMLLGYVNREVCTCVPDFTVYDAAGQTVLRISGPLCMCGFDRQFTIFSATQDCAVGEIKKQWSGAIRELFTNVDVFGFNFPWNLDVKVKALLLGAAILIAYMPNELDKDGNADVTLIGPMAMNLSWGCCLPLKNHLEILKIG